MRPEKERENIEPTEFEPNHTTVSFIESGKPERNIPPRSARQIADEAEYYPPPQIRRMSDSTRAREAEKNRHSRKPRFSEDYTYEKERPDGEYAYTHIHNEKKYKKKKRSPIQDDLTAMATETLQLDLRDIVPVAVPPENPVKPVDVKPAPRAQRTSVNLSSKDAQTPDSLDVTIRRTPEEAERETRRRQHVSAMMKLENTADIRSDIAELRSAVAFRATGLMIAAIVSAYLSIRKSLPFIWLNSIPENLICLMQFLLGMAAASVCVPALRNGISRLFQFRADTDTLAAVAWLTCMIDSFFSIFGINHHELPTQFMPCAILILLLHTIGKLFIIDREEINLKAAAGQFLCYGLHIIENDNHAETLTRGVLNDFPITAAMRKTDSLKDFRKYTYSADLADYFSRYAAPASCIFSLVASVVLTLVKGENIGYFLGLLSMFSVSVGCAAITFVVNLPLFKSAKKLSPHGALLLGYQSVDDFYDTNSLVLDATALFPAGSIQLRGIKSFSDVKAEETVLAAASLVRCAGSAYSHIFDEVLQGKERRLYPIENYSYEEDNGLCGWIHNQRILFGTRDLMITHHIEGIPSKTKEAELAGAAREALYLSISGNLSAIFIVELQADMNIKFWMQKALKRNMCLILHNIDPLITVAKLAELFDVPQNMLKIIPARMDHIYNEETHPVKEMRASMACTNTFSNVMRLISCSKVVRTTAVAGIFLQAVSMLIGLIFVIMESLLHVGVTPGLMIIFHCITTIMTIAIVNIRRVF